MCVLLDHLKISVFSLLFLCVLCVLLLATLAVAEHTGSYSLNRSVRK